MEKRVDRRIVRTKRALYDAIFSLLQEQSYTSLTVQDIATRADVNRATFYQHFTDKEALLEEGLDVLFEELREEAASKMEAMPLLDNLIPNQVVFEHVAKHRELYTALLEKMGAGFVMQRMIDAIVAFGEDYFLSQYTPDMLAHLTIPPAMIPQHMAGSLFALLRWWIREGMPHSAQEMARMSHELGMRGVWSMVGYQPETVS